MVDLPQLGATDRFPALPALGEARRAVGATAPAVPGAQLAALREAVPVLRDALVASGRPAAVTTGDLLTLPYPTTFGLWRAARSPAPLLWLTARLLVVQWDDPDGTARTLLWCPSDHARRSPTPSWAGAVERAPRSTGVRATVHGTVLGHLKALGIDPADVDYLAFDNLQGQDVRRLLGTARPAPDLDHHDAPVAGWFPRATLVTHEREWAGLASPHPLQRPWYQPATFADLPPDRVALLADDVLLGPGVALVATPGRTPGNLSLALHTDEGVWVSSGNGVAAESWAPRASRIPGLRRWSVAWDQEVVLDANTVEAAAQQYDAMVVEKLLADPAPDAPVPCCFPTRELTPHRLAPGITPTYVHARLEHGTVRGSAVLRGRSGGTAT